jgi:U3 small nucleolar RNA-associated protein 3
MNLYLRSTPKRLRLLDGPPEIKNTKRDQLLTGDEQMAIEMFEATQNKRKKKKKEEEEETDESEEATGPVDEGEEGDEDNRRLITYQIQKNKGLTPKRSKLQRNPRVKHRHKFEKAKIRRKGAVREVRKENKKYGGEISGINARVKKGVKLA